MKSIFSFVTTLACLLLINSCGKNNSANENASTVPTNDVSLTVYANKSHLAADGVEEVVFTVKDKTNLDVTSSAVIYVNDKALAKNIFTTTNPGNYTIRATQGTKTSTVISLTATTAILITTTGTPPAFTQKVLAEFYTGTWCGICPGTIIPLESYANANPNTIMIGIHGPSGSNDPFQYVYDTQLRNAFGVSGVPTVVLNRTSNWDGNNATLDQLVKNSALLGIGLETTVSGNTINVKVNVKFGATITAQLKIVVMLVEDGILYDQTNYGHFNLPNPIVNFAHRNVLRSTATDIFGDPVPLTQQTMNNTWQKTFSLDASKYQVPRLRVVAFVLYDSNNGGLKGVLNSQIVKAGESINF